MNEKNAIKQISAAQKKVPRGALLRFSAALALFAPLPSFAADSPPPRFSSAPLNRSVQNETNAAIDRARDWLAKKQSPDGSWENDADSTALAFIALGGENPAARAWLAAATNQTAWTAIALNMENAAAFLAAALPTNAPPIAKLSLEKNPKKEILRGELEKLVPALGLTQAADSEIEWWIARSLNILAPDFHVPWRDILADRWVNHQTIDQNGGGNWNGNIKTTAFAILLLCEI